MSLLDQARAPQTSGSAPASAAESGPAGISKGAAYQKKQKEARYQAALLIQGALKRGNVTLTSDEAKAIELLTKKPGSGSAHSFGKPIIYRLFGDVPKVGPEISTKHKAFLAALVAAGAASPKPAPAPVLTVEARLAALEAWRSEVEARL